MLAALDALDPDVVCIEGPPEAEPVLDLAADPAMVPPIALLAYDPDQPTRASFWPLAAFSPEWQALRWAQRHGRPVRFIDLPAAHSLAGQDEERRARASRDPLAQLAAAAGYGDVERWWDDLVEHGTSDVFEAVEEAMAAVRETSPPAGPRERQREAAMRRALAAVVADGFGRVAVVCGAWHVPALPRAAERRRRGRAAGAAQGQGGDDLGAVVEPPPGRGERLRRRGPRARLVRPPVPPRRTTGHRPLVLRGGRACCGPAATRPRRRRSSTPPAWPRRWRRCAAVPWPAWPR